VWTRWAAMIPNGAGDPHLDAHHREDPAAVGEVRHLASAGRRRPTPCSCGIERPDLAAGGSAEQPDREGDVLAHRGIAGRRDLDPDSPHRDHRPQHPDQEQAQHRRPDHDHDLAVSAARGIGGRGHEDHEQDRPEPGEPAAAHPVVRARAERVGRAVGWVGAVSRRPARCGVTGSRSTGAAQADVDPALFAARVRRRGHGRGTGVRPAISASTRAAPAVSTVPPTLTRWANTGTTTACTSSGVTWWRPATTAWARAACTSPTAARGEAPMPSPGWARVAATSVEHVLDQRRRAVDLMDRGDGRGHRGGVGHRPQVGKDLVAALSGEDLALGRSVGQAHREHEAEPVELALRQRESADLPCGFWVATQKNGFGSGWVTPSTVTWCSSIGSRSAAWVRGEARLISVDQHDVGEQRPRPERPRSVGLGVDGGARDVRRQQVGGALDAAEPAAQGGGQALGEQGLAGAREVLDQEVAARQEGHERQADDVVLAADRGRDGSEQRAGEGDRGVGGGRFREGPAG